MALIVPAFSAFPLGEVSPQMFGDPMSPAYRRGASECVNFRPLRQTGFTKMPGTLYQGHTASDATARMVKWIVKKSLPYVMEFTNNSLRFWKYSGGALSYISGQDVTTTYTTSELNALQFSYQYPHCFITHQNHAPAMITYSATDTFAYKTIPFSGANPEYYTGTISSSTTLTLTTALTPDIPGGSTYTNYDGWAVTGSGIPAGTTISSVTSSTVVVLSEASTDAGGISVTLSNLYVSGQTPALPFQSSGNYPAVCCVAFQRLYFANTENKPLGLWGSIVGIFDTDSNVQMGTYETVQYQSSQMQVDSSGNPTSQPPTYTTTWTNADNVFDADGVYYVLNSDRNDEIQWIAPSVDLFIGSASALWVVPADSTANTFSAQIVERSGSGPVQGAMVEGGCVFTDPYGLRVGQIGWHGIYNPWLPPDDLTFFSSHLFNKETIDLWDFAQHPRTVLYFTTSQGNLICLEMDNAHKVRAWFHRTTSGTITSATVITGSDRDVVVLSVTRNSYNLVEIIDDDNWYDTTATNDGQVNANYLDAAVTQSSSTAFTTVTGLDHLDGLSVGMVGDGAYQGTATVASGSVTLTTASKVAHVGLEFTAHLQSAPVDIATEVQSSVGMPKGITQVYVRALRTLDCSIGPDSGTLQSMSLDSVDVTVADPAMFTGDEIVPFSNPEASPAYVYIQSAKPLPCTILAFDPETDVSSA